MLAGVGKTALGMAMLRAHETRRDDRLFEDPYAQAFVDASPGAFDAEAAAGSPVGARFYLHGVVRTRFFDDYLLGAGCGQVVLLAAGLDTRAYRLAWPPGVRLFELDLPEVLAFKEDVLAGRARAGRGRMARRPRLADAHARDGRGRRLVRAPGLRRERRLPHRHP